jgi:hypothetical protein
MAGQKSEDVHMLEESTVPSVDQVKSVAESESICSNVMSTSSSTPQRLADNNNNNNNEPTRTSAISIEKRTSTGPQRWYKETHHEGCSILSTNVFCDEDANSNIKSIP